MFCSLSLWQEMEQDPAMSKGWGGDGAHRADWAELRTLGTRGMEQPDTLHYHQHQSPRICFSSDLVPPSPSAPVCPSPVVRTATPPHHRSHTVDSSWTSSSTKSSLVRSKDPAWLQPVQVAWCVWAAASHKTTASAVPLPLHRAWLCTMAHSATWIPTAFRPDTSG